MTTKMRTRIDIQDTINTDYRLAVSYAADLFKKEAPSEEQRATIHTIIDGKLSTIAALEWALGKEYTPKWAEIMKKGAKQAREVQ